MMQGRLDNRPRQRLRLIMPNDGLKDSLKSVSFEVESRYDVYSFAGIKSEAFK